MRNEERPAFERLNREIARAIGRAVSDFSMIREGDRILIGLSGGKDSALLACALRRLQSRSPVRFKLAALTVDPTDGGADLSALERFAATLGIEYRRADYPLFAALASGVSDSACSLCANIRRGILASGAREMGCNVLALGHHRDDAVETVFLNLLYTGRFRCFHPNMTMTRADVRVIRPMVYVRERDIERDAARLALPLADFACPHAAGSKRAAVKEKVRELSTIAPDMASNVIHALRSCREGDAWTEEDRGAPPHTPQEGGTPP